MMAYALADRLGEIDPRKIMDLPADILMHWQAFIDIQNEPTPESPVRETPQPAEMTDDELFAAHRRILGNG
ncbi:hypothetical protein HTE05_23910 [Serratia marcescens]|uniref:hypothetical protein n=1 Tax=Serratia marcescens TaxID=615 RepID=UPI001570757D|nr:hypothetical protein [Serratia marcescens]NSL16651.1 hypothetical protein [Serratia marcescens]